MRRNNPLVIIILIFTSCKSDNSVLTNVIHFPAYPSASGIEYYNNKFFIIGDDATQLLILDSNLTTSDSMRLYDGIEKKLPKEIKSDLESASLTDDNRLLILGSGSKAPYRFKGWLIDPNKKSKDSLQLDTFYQRLALNGIKELNIEGATAIPGHFVLSSRGNKGYRKNHLIITDNRFWEKQSQCNINTMLSGINTDSSTFSGISGMAFSGKSDLLILSVSTEDTHNTIDDGAIGKSYLWFISNFSSKRRWKAVNPTKVIDLSTIDPRFKGQKIESVCITKETSDFLHLVLAADNDNGSSTLFKVIIQKD